jgi:hypothetical protein
MERRNVGGRYDGNIEIGLKATGSGLNWQNRDFSDLPLLRLLQILEFRSRRKKMHN